MFCIFTSTNLSIQSSCFTYTQLADKSTILKHHWLFFIPTNLVMNHGGILLIRNVSISEGVLDIQKVTGDASWAGDSFSAVYMLWKLSVKQKPSTPLPNSVINRHKYFAQEICRSRRKGKLVSYTDSFPTLHTGKDGLSVQTSRISISFCCSNYSLFYFSQMLN